MPVVVYRKQWMPERDIQIKAHNYIRWPTMVEYTAACVCVCHCGVYAHKTMFHPSASEDKYIFLGCISYVRNDFSCSTYETKCPSGCQIQTKARDWKTEEERKEKERSGLKRTTNDFIFQWRVTRMSERETDWVVIRSVFVCLALFFL